MKNSLLFCIFTTVLVGLLRSGLYAQNNLEITTEPVVVALYKNCGNEIKITKPDLSNANIQYHCSGATLINREGDIRFITLVPYSPHVILSIYRDSILIGKTQFKVRLINRPTIQLYADSNLIENGVLSTERIKKGISTFTVKAKAGEQTVADVPYDARFTVKSWQIVLLRDSKRLDSLQLAEEKGDIKKILSQTRTGDKLLIEFQKIYRTNFLNQNESLDLTNKYDQVITIE